MFPDGLLPQVSELSPNTAASHQKSRNMDLETKGTRVTLKKDITEEKVYIFPLNQPVSS